MAPKINRRGRQSECFRWTEAVEAMADDAFRALADRPRIRARWCRPTAGVSSPVSAASRCAWSMGLIWWYPGGTPVKRPALSGRCFRKSSHRYPDGRVTLRVREISWKLDLKAAKADPVHCSGYEEFRAGSVEAGVSSAQRVGGTNERSPSRTHGRSRLAPSAAAPDRTLSL